MPYQTYRAGHIKRDPVTGDVALRTVFPEDQGQQLADLAWLIATQNQGAKTANAAVVDDWDDVYEPTVPDDDEPLDDSE
jgi:hypothetical protein